MVKPLLDAEALYYSPGSAPHLVKRAKDGQLLAYPVVEDTLTPVPAQPRLRAVDQIKAAYKSAGLAEPELPAEETESGGPEAGDGGPSTEAIAQAKARARALKTRIEISKSEV